MIANATSEWARLPVAGVGYVHPDKVLALDDDDLRGWIAAFENVRYGGWRNHEGLWRRTLGLDDTYGKKIIDWGCGYGIEALQFARGGNDLILADLTIKGLEAARRVLNVSGYDAWSIQLPAELPEADIFYANGSLHHTPEMPEIMASVPCSEARLMVYSDRAWADKGGPGFVRAMDEVGTHADYYSPETLEAACPGWRLRESTYITPWGWYLTAILDRD